MDSRVKSENDGHAHPFTRSLAARELFQAIAKQSRRVTSVSQKRRERYKRIGCLNKHRIRMLIGAYLSSRCGDFIVQQVST